MKLIKANLNNLEKAVEIIEMGKNHLKEQGIDQWQTGYPDYECIKNDITNQKGYFLSNNNEFIAYMYIDFSEEVAYNNIIGKWSSKDPYAVVHRLAFHDKARGQNLSNKLFELIEDFCVSNNVFYIRIDTDDCNPKMKHILSKNNFKYCGVIQFDGSEKLGFDKLLKKPL